jgi:uncharacterized protein YjbI with pentapeptide repeats
LPKCQFTTKYSGFPLREEIEFNCQEDEEEILASGFCFFHDKDYLQDKTNYEEHKAKVLEKLKHKVNHAISNNEPLLCIGFQLPDFSLSGLSISKEFTKPVYFNGSRFFGKEILSNAKFQEVSFHKTNFHEMLFFDKTIFQGEADFSEAKFQAIASFSEAAFQEQVDFSDANFQAIANFFNMSFKGKVDFTFANFQVANFDAANFQGDAFFYQPNFQGKASFNRATFKGEADFSGADFQGDASFYEANFQGKADIAIANFHGEANFYNSEFYGRTHFSRHFNGGAKFNYVLFEGKQKVIFDIENLSNVSFINSDITGVRFSDKARWGEKKVEYDKFWGGKKVKEDRFKIVDERFLEEKINRNKKRNIKPAIENEPAIQEDEKKDGHTTKDFNLGSIKAMYRNLRENYEYRMRWDEAGQFFIREMELQRKYREVVSKEEENSLDIKQNNWFRRNLFSLIGWYYHLSRYGESLWRPTLAGLVIVFLSTLFWLIQINPSAKPSFTNTVGFANATNITVWQTAFERSMADFLPILSMGEGVKVGIIDYVIKIVGGAVTFGLIAISLRRRFERRYRH